MISDISLCKKTGVRAGGVSSARDSRRSPIRGGKAPFGRTRFIKEEDPLLLCVERNRGTCRAGIGSVGLRFTGKRRRKEGISRMLLGKEDHPSQERKAPAEWNFPVTRK